MLKPSFFSSSRNQIILVLLLSFSVYVNIFQNGFVLDDKTFIRGWEKIRSLEHLPELIAGEMPEGHFGAYRPVHTILLAIYYSFFGQSPFGYHLMALIMHLASTVFVYLVAERLTKKHSIAIVTALLFGLHPIHTEAVNYMNASIGTTGALFALISFYLYLRYKEDKNNIGLYLSIVASFMAVFSSELFLSYPIMFLVYEFLFGDWKKQGIKIFKIPSVYLLPIATYAFIRFVLLEIPGRAEYAANSFFLTMVTTVKVFFRYIVLLVVPSKLAHNHIIPNGIEAILYRGYNRHPIIEQSIFQTYFLLSLLVLSAFVVLAIALYRLSPLVTFCISWFFVLLLPVANIIPQWTFMHERFLYLASFGPILLFAYFLRPLLSKRKSLALFIVGIIALFYGYLTFTRNFAWKSEQTLWESDIASYPGKNAYAYLQLGNYYWERRELSKAISSYERSFEINPNSAVAIASAARAYSEQGNIEAAIARYKKALEVDPFFWEATVHLALIDDSFWQEIIFKEATLRVPKQWQLAKSDVLTLKDNNTGFIVTLNIDKNKKIVKVYVWPANSPFMPIVDKIVSSIKFP